jgi:hypothetical protein
MISEAKAIANRRNAQRSTGPRSKAGKSRSRLNALRHGLTIKHDLAFTPRMEPLANQLAHSSHEPIMRAAAVDAAQAQLDVERVQKVKSQLLERAAHLLRGQAYSGLSVAERKSLAFAGEAKALLACIRYEQRARSKRNRAIQAIGTRRKELWERTGPRIPRIRFRTEFLAEVHTLSLNDSVKAARFTGHPTTRTSFPIGLQQLTLRDVRTQSVWKSIERILLAPGRS